jgi:DNA polymerase I-like protein with 3'-5' exonuclease and polymerase domains
MIYFIGNDRDTAFIQRTTIENLLEYFSDKSEIGFDTETMGFDPYLAGLISYQLGDKENQFVVSAVDYPIEMIQDLLVNKELIIHNAKFDLKFLYHKNIYPKKVWDTYLGECVLYKGDKTVRKSLEATLLRYINKQLNKSIRGKIINEKFSDRVIKYCAEDVEYLGLIKNYQIARLKLNDLLKSMDLENEFVKVLTYIEYSGIHLNSFMWKKKILQDRNLFNNSLQVLNNWIIKNDISSFIESQLDLFNTEKQSTINWSSPKQVVELFQLLGIDTKTVDDKTGEIKDSVEADILEKQRDVSPIVPLYIQYKKYERILTTYGESVLKKIHPITDRIHTQFTQILDTGRLSSGGKRGDEDTINLQNIPRLPEDKEEDKIYERECFLAEKDNVLIDADYSGQEQIVFANWTQDPDILKFYKNNLGDMHSYIASKIFPELKNLPLNDIKKYHKEKRQIAKSAGFAINYGGNGNTIADNLNISREEGEEIYQAYFTAFPGVSTYFKKVTNRALRDGYITFNNISKSKCFISFFSTYKKLETQVNSPGFWEQYRIEKIADSSVYRRNLKPLVSKYFKLKGEISRMALNYPIQGSSAEITKIACILIFNYIVDNNLTNVVKFSNVIHDEILIECPRNYQFVMKQVVEDCMQKAGDLYCKIVPLRAEANICLFWNH